MAEKYKVRVDTDRLNDLTWEQMAILVDWAKDREDISQREIIGVFDGFAEIERNGKPLESVGKLPMRDLKDVIGDVMEQLNEGLGLGN